MSDLYDSGHRRFQAMFDTVRLAERLEQTIVRDTIDAEDAAFIESMDLFFLATVDRRGWTNCSYKGGEPGFVRVVGPRTIAFPNYDGNGMYLSMGNIAVTNQVGILFIDFERQSRLRLNGIATIDPSDRLMDAFPEAQCIVRVQVREIFPNCPRYIHQMQRVARSRFVPRAGCRTPVPKWKKGDWVEDVLPDNDPAKDPSRDILDR